MVARAVIPEVISWKEDQEPQPVSATWTVLGHPEADMHQKQKLKRKSV